MATAKIIISLVVGISIGAGLVRYGIGLGTAMVYQIKEDMPRLGLEGGTQTDQVNTDGTTDEELEQGEMI